MKQKKDLRLFVLFAFKNSSQFKFLIEFKVTNTCVIPL